MYFGVAFIALLVSSLFARVEMVLVPKTAIESLHRVQDETRALSDETGNTF